MIGTRIRQLRKEANMSQDEFARVIGISRSYLSRVERDDTGVSQVTVNLIAERFRVRKEWLEEGKGAKERVEGEEEKKLGSAQVHDGASEYRGAGIEGLSVPADIKYYLSMALDVLTSGNTVLKDALVGSLRGFKEALDQAARAEELERRVGVLEGKGKQATSKAKQT